LKSIFPYNKWHHISTPYSIYSTPMSHFLFALKLTILIVRQTHARVV